MKTKPLLLLVALFCWSAPYLLAQEKGVNGSNDRAITVEQYCTFLNEVAAATPLKLKVEAINSDDLYDERTLGAFIMRTGLPGNYYYNFISSASTDSIHSYVTGLSRNDALQYCEWRNHSASTSTYNLNSCGYAAAHVDPELKSNLLTFCLVSSEALAHQASGEEVIPSLLSEAEEFALAVMGIAGGGGRPLESRSIFNRSFDHGSETDFRNSPTTASPISTSLFTEPAYLKEKEQTARVLGQLVHTSKEGNDGTRYLSYYAEPDRYWQQDKQAWEGRTAAQRDLELTTATLLQAQEHLTTAIEERSKLDTQKTLLARISQVAGKAAAPLSFIPGPVPLGGIAHTVSGIADKLNQVWVEKDVMLAEQAVTGATHKVEQATEHANATNERAAILRKKAQEAEGHARLLELAARKDDMERLHPPVTSLNEDDWKEWATRLVQTGRGDASYIEELVNHGMSDPLWAAEMVTTALNQRAQEHAHLAEEEKRRRLEPFEQAFQTASQALQAAHEITTDAATAAARARQRLEAATQVYDYWKAELEETNATLSELEKPEHVRKAETASAIILNKEKFSAALSKLEQAYSDLQTCEEVVKEADAVLALEENKTLSLRNEATAIEETLLRNRERATLPQEKKPSQVILRLPRFSDAGIFTTEKLERGEKAHNNARLLSPEILSKTYETIGKALLKDKRVDELQEKQEPAVTQRLLPEIREPSPEDLARWEAGLRAEDFIEERDEVIANIKRRTPSHSLSQASEEAETTATGLSAIREENENESDEEHGGSLDGSINPLLSRKHHRKGESSRASSMTTKTRSEKSQSSIGSFVSKNSVHSWSGSVAGSIPASVASSATKSELKNLKKATRAINDMANQWAELVRKADAERVAAGGVPYADEEMLFEAWQESDTIAQVAWKKRCSIQEETLRAAAMATTWEVSTVRWEARAEADRLLHDQEEAEIDLVSLIEQQKPLDPVWTSQYQNASEHLKAMEKVATEAQKKWTRLAEQEPSIQKAQGKEEKNNALKKLRARDQAINAFWERVQEDYYAEKDYEPRRVEKARLLQETSAYQFDLITEKISTMATCFAEADEAQQQSAADFLEQSAITKYAEATLQEALKAAWEKIPGAEAAWEFRVSKAEKESRAAQRKLETSKDAGSKASSTETKMATRLAAIARADKKAFETLQVEAKEVADIEATWKAQLKEEEGATLLRRIAAARDYSQGDLTAWHALPHQEREIYNEAVRVANETAIDMVQSRLQEAWENTQEWHQKMTKAWRVFSKKSMEQIAQKAIAELVQLKAHEDERKIAIRQAKIAEFDYQAAQEEICLHSLGSTTAKDVLKTVTSLRTEIAERAAVEAKNFCDSLEIAWAHKADVVQTGYNQAAHYAERVRASWDQLGEAKRAELGKLPEGHHELMVAATLDLIKAEEEKEAWREKKTEEEKIAQAALDPLILKTKAVFEAVRNAWEVLRHHENREHAENVLLMTDAIKAHVATVADTDLDTHAYSALMAMSTTADALAELTIAARNHARIRIGGGVGGAGAGVSAGSAIASVTAGTLSGSIFVTGVASFGAGFVVITGGFGAIPIVMGGGYLYYKYRKRNNPEAAPLLPPLAPRTTELARTIISKAQETTEAAARETATTIWAADTAWCRDAIREAQELVNAITHSVPAVEAEENSNR